jgi:hypothetical protein
MFIRMASTYPCGAPRGRPGTGHFLAAKIPEPLLSLVQPVQESDAKLLAWSTLEATAGATIGDALAAPTELTAALASRLLRRSAHFMADRRQISAFAGLG